MSDICKTDVLTLELGDLLVSDYGVDPSELDRGAGVAVKDDEGNFARSVEGAYDGCSSYAEVTRKAIEVATDAAIAGRSEDFALIDTLACDHSIDLPWLFYDPEQASAFDFERTAEARADMGAMRQSLLDEGFDPEGAAFKAELGRRIFEGVVPFERMRGGDFDPMLAAYRLYPAMRMAGLDVEFVVIPTDPLGNLTPDHVALSIRVDDGSSIIADPAYEVYGLTGLPSFAVDLAQAMSLYHTHMATRSDEPLVHLDMARRLDPSNARALVLEAHARAGVKDPLMPFRKMYWNDLRRSRSWFDAHRR
jgi:hypothetical protein